MSKQPRGKLSIKFTVVTEREKASLSQSYATFLMTVVGVAEVHLALALSETQPQQTNQATSDSDRSK